MFSVGCLPFSQRRESWGKQKFQASIQDADSHSCLSMNDEVGGTLLGGRNVAVWDGDCQEYRKSVSQPEKKKKKEPNLEHRVLSFS